MGRFNPRSLLAVANYLNIAKKYQLNPVHMALRFVIQNHLRDLQFLELLQMNS